MYACVLRHLPWSSLGRHAPQSRQQTWSAACTSPMHSQLADIQPQLRAHTAQDSTEMVSTHLTWKRSPAAPPQSLNVGSAQLTLQPCPLASSSPARSNTVRSLVCQLPSLPPPRENRGMSVGSNQSHASNRHPSFSFHEYWCNSAEALAAARKETALNISSQGSELGIMPCEHLQACWMDHASAALFILHRLYLLQTAAPGGCACTSRS